MTDSNRRETDTTGVQLERLLSYREVADILGLTDRTVWELVRKGELQNVRVGRSVRVDPADLRRYIDLSKPVSREQAD